MIFFIKSIIIGILAIFPGISGSAFAISLNMYDKIIYSFKNIKENKLFFLIVACGLIIGIIIGSNIIIYFSGYKEILYYGFIGLIIGDVPLMIKKVNCRGNIRFFPLVFSFAFSILTLFYCKNMIIGGNSFLKMFVAGLLFSFGKIFPGVSSSFFLIILGVYKEILVLFSNPITIFSNLSYYFPFIIGGIIGLIIFIKLLNYLLIEKYDILYSALIGLMISSIIPIIPKFELSAYNIIGVIIMMACSVISFKFKLKKAI